VTGLVCWLSDVLNEVVTLQQLSQVYSVCVIVHVNMYVEVTADYDWTLIRRQLFKHRRQIVTEYCRQRLTAWTVDAE